MGSPAWAYVVYVDTDGTEVTLSPGDYALTINAPATGAAWGIGGTLTYEPGGNPAPDGTSIVLMRVVPYIQTTSFINQGNFNPTALEQALDYEMMAIEQLAAQVSASGGGSDTSIRIPFGTDVGAVNAYVTSSTTPAVTSLFSGLVALVQIGTANTGASTLDLNGTGARDITHVDSSALNFGDLAVNGMALMAYDGINDEWQLLSIFSTTTGAVTSVTGSGGVTAAPTTGAVAVSLTPILSPHLLANTTGSLASPTDTSISTFLDAAVSADPGSLAVRNTSGWQGLGPGASGTQLTSGGVGGNLSWQAGSGDASSINYTGSFTGAQTETVQARLTREIWLDDIVPGGNTTDYGPYITALSSALPMGGRCLLSPSKNYPVLTSCTIPKGVSLGFVYENVGTVTTQSESSNFALFSALTVASSATISLAPSAGVKGLLVYRSGMAFPASNSSAFAGNPFLGIGDDCFIEDCLILGFGQAFQSTNVNRVRILRTHFDNNANILITNSLDTCYIEECHAWPYTTHISGDTAARNMRTGANFKIVGSNDWTKVAQSFCYGYDTGWWVDSSASVTFTGVGADNVAVGGFGTGFKVSGSTLASDTLFTGCQAAANEQGWAFTATAGVTSPSMLVNCSAWGNINHGILVDTGSVCAVTILGGLIRNSVNAVTVASASSIVQIDKTIMQAISATNPINATVATTNIYIGNNNVYPDSTAGRSAAGVNAVTQTITPAAAVLALPAQGNLFSVAAGNFANLTGGYAGRIVTLEFQGVSVLTSSALVAPYTTMLLAGGSNYTSAAGGSITLVHLGATGWVEASRQQVASGGTGLVVTDSTIAVASATTCNIGAAASNLINITGTTTITSFGSGAATGNALYWVYFSAALQITASVNITTPNGANITTALGDSALLRYVGAGVWYVMDYNKQSGQPLIRPSLFSTSSTTQGEVPGSNSVGATYFLNGNGAWAIPSGSGSAFVVDSTQAITSAATTDLGSVASNLIAVNGTATITSFGNSASTGNAEYFLYFGGACTITSNANITTPGGLNITTVAGDTARLRFVGSSVWYVEEYNRTSGQPLRAVALTSLATQAASTVVANITGGAAAPTAISTTQLTALVNTFTSGLSGAVPASGGGSTKYLNADGAFTTIAGSGVTSVATSGGITGGTITTTGTISLSSIANNSVLGNTSGISTTPTAQGQNALLGLLGFLSNQAAKGGFTVNTTSGAIYVKWGTVTLVNPGTGASTTFDAPMPNGTFVTVLTAAPFTLGYTPAVSLVAQSASGITVDANSAVTVVFISIGR